MFTERTSVGLDVHARSVAAAAIDGVTGELIQTRLSPAHDHIRSWIGALPGPVAVTYEAGPTGFDLSRMLSAAGIRCEVAAPSKLQRPAGDRVKTDKKDALHLARLLRMDEITAVVVPSVADESARDLVRAREDCRRSLTQAKHRLNGLLLRHGLVYYDGRPWTGRHDRWLQGLRFDQVGTRLAFEDNYETVVAALARRSRLDAQIEQMAAECEQVDLVRRLACLRGVAVLTSFALAVEIGDWHRFTGNSLGAFVGLVPSESSSGGAISRGPITRTGNGHARRLLVEAAWHHRRAYVAGKTMRARWEQATPAAAARADEGNRRLHRRWARFDARGKKAVVANTAIARELAGWCWSLAVMD
ncbi:IS110 family RNA-guided transposase [Nocardioides jensenii]|uniref:IS110 family transposase n=1 Tax=Nocardioides jensenii TaxID=1843 RepID=UPI00082F7C9A|nr:IS110 family transposase [Nocardioides jensenii]